LKAWATQTSFTQSFKRKLCDYFEKNNKDYCQAKKGELSKVVVPTTRGPSVSILGAICSLCVINLGLKVTRAKAKWRELVIFY
jgi:hypothetical protein